MQATPIIDAIFDTFGGPKKLADAMGEAITTVHSWKGSKYGIPRWRRPQILSAANAAGKQLPPEALTYLASSARIAA